MKSFVAIAGFLAVMFLVGSIEASGNPVLSQPLAKEVAGKPRPCYRHHDFTEPTKRECLKRYRQVRRAEEKQARRDRLKWPPMPVTKRDVQVRVPDWYRFVRLGRCEQPGSGKYGDGVRWHVRATWGGGVGLYHQTWRVAGSPYAVHNGNKWATILVSDAIRDRFGITAWGAHRCFWHGPNRPVGTEGRA